MVSKIKTVFLFSFNSVFLVLFARSYWILLLMMVAPIILVPAFYFGQKNNARRRQVLRFLLNWNVTIRFAAALLMVLSPYLFLRSLEIVDLDSFRTLIETASDFKVLLTAIFSVLISWLFAVEVILWFLDLRLLFGDTWVWRLATWKVPWVILL